MSGVKTFQQWCEDNGKRWIGAASFDEFEANAKAYEEYCAKSGQVLRYSGWEEDKE